MKYKRVLLPMAFVLCSCTYGSYTMSKGSYKFLSNECSANYESFDGYIARKFNVKNEPLSFTFTYLSNEENEGFLSLQIEGVEKTIYDNLLNGNMDFSLDTGKYTIKIVGDNHSGSFSLKW